MPLERIENLLQTRGPEIDAWFAEKNRGLAPLPYFSCDVRHAGYKIGVVDTNLFPAGFNNLCATFRKATAAAFRGYLDKFHSHATRVLIYGENHTRNKFYLLNLVRLKELIEAAGRECRVTLPLPHYPNPKIEIPLDGRESLTIEETRLDGGKLVTMDGFAADLVLSNNDFSAGTPAGWESLAIPVVPSPELGWHKRSKSAHFGILRGLIDGFGAAFGIDPWLLMPVTRIVEGVSSANFAQLRKTVTEVTTAVAAKYAEYQIAEEPYVFVKNDAGTYGLGIVTLSDAAELDTLNRKKREKLFAAKSGAQTSRFIVQEGIPTSDTYSGFPIEPVIYGVGGEPVGGFFRVHESKSPFESLNAPGMTFSCLCLHKLDEPHESYFINCKDKLRLVTGAKFLARFAALAAAKERV